MAVLDRRHILLALAAATGAVCLTASLAEEGGAGHYAPGTSASFVDALPGRPGLAVANYFMYYGSSASDLLPFGGLPTFDSRALAYSDSLMIMYDTNLKLLAGDYVPAVAVTYVWLEVEGKITEPLGPVSVHDSADGLGDLVVYPFMLGWVKNDFKYDLRLGIYAPTGEYEEGRLANVAKNFWTFEPMVSVTWLSSKIGTEVSAYAGLDFNTRNEETDYHSGDVVHVDATVAQHLPLGKLGSVGVGANAFYYQQITGDIVEVPALETEFEGFEGRTVGVGPVLSFTARLGENDLAAELKWLPELDVQNRLKGDYVWFKLGMAF